MKRFGLSILIGIGCSLVVFIFIQLRKNKLNFRSNKPLYDAELKIKIGSVADDKRSITTTVSQIKKRTDFTSDPSAEQLDKNNFLITLKKVSDTATMKRLVSESIELRFLETFLITEIADSLSAIDNELSRRRKKNERSSDSSEKYAFLLEEIDIESKKKNGTCRLNQLINFSSGFQDMSGNVRFPAALGVVKTRDTVYLNKLLNDEEIKSKFPPKLVFAYGTRTDHFKEDDSALNIYSIKATDPKLYPLPTGDNIKDCEVDFEPGTGYPVIVFEFDVDGSNYWYTMTKRNKGKPVAILIDDIVLTAPVVEEAILGGSSRITGDFTVEEAMYLRSMIRTDKLALPVEIVESKFAPTKKSIRIVWMLGLVFLVSASLAYGISFLIKPVSKP